MCLSSDVIGLIELDEPIACEDWLDGTTAPPRWRCEEAAAAPVTVVVGNLTQLAAELHGEWRALVACLPATSRSGKPD